MGDIFNVLLLQNMLRTATPVALAAMGCLMTHHVNITNIGIDGMMLIGAFFAVLASYTLHSWLAGLAAAMVVGVLLGLFYYVFVIKFGSDEFIIGTALNIFATALTTFLLREALGVTGSFSSPEIVPLPTIHLPLIEQIPVLGQLLSGHTLLTYVTWILVPVCWAFIYKTPIGAHMRASGEYPDALVACGGQPARLKCLSSVLCGILACLAGAHLSLGYLTMFSENMSSSRGFIAFACVLFGQGNPPVVFLAALMFGFVNALGLRIQKIIPSDLTAMLPYAVTVIMMVVVVVMQRRKKQRMARQQMETMGR